MKNTETERKFLVNQHILNALSETQGTRIVQAYIHSEAEKTVRVRIYGSSAFLTIKGKTTHFSRPEFEYEIPVEDAQNMLRLFAEQIIEKTRYKIDFKGHTWEVDVFHGENEGLIIAELELESAEEEFPIPVWISKEVSGDKRYYNSYLAQNSYKYWKAG